MHQFVRFLIAVAFVAVLAVVDQSQTLADPWSQQVIARGPYRTYLRSLPIEARPDRPFHFYGNTIRRLHRRKHSAHVNPTHLAPATGIWFHHHVNPISACNAW